METKAEETITVRETRSYARSIQQGLRASADHASTVLAHTWPAMLLSLLLPFPGLVIYAGQVDQLMRDWQQQGTLPRRKPQEGLKADLHSMLRAAARLLLSGGTFMAVLLCTWATWTYLPHGMWWAMGTLVVLTAIVTPVAMVCMDIACSTHPLTRCMPALMSGYRHYSSLLAYEVLLVMLVLLITLPGQLPCGITTVASMQWYQAVQEGDTVLMPPMMSMAYVAAYLICTLSVLVAMTVSAFCDTLFWGSIQAREAEQKEV